MTLCGLALVIGPLHLQENPKRIPAANQRGYIEMQTNNAHKMVHACSCKHTGHTQLKWCSRAQQQSVCAGATANHAYACCIAPLISVCSSAEILYTFLLLIRLCDILMPMCQTK